MPLTHDMGLIGFHLVPLMAGIHQYILPTSLFIRRPVLWMTKANQHKATLLSSPNFGYKYFLSFFKSTIENDWDLSHIRLIFNGAEPISNQLCQEFLNKMEIYGLQRTAMFPVYGLAEASLAVAFPPLGEELVSIYLDRNYLNIGNLVKEVTNCNSNAVSFVDLGYPVDNCLVCIRDQKDQPLDDGKIGNIHIQGANVTSGYYNNVEVTNRMISKDGWLNTGDLGFINNGRLVVTGRAKDILFLNGQNFYAHDIERIAEEIDGVELGELAVFGVLNEEQQKDDIILVVLFKKELEKFLPLALDIKKHIGITMGLEIKYIIPVKKIPKTTSGKLMRFKLKEMYQNGEFSLTLQTLDRLFYEYQKLNDNYNVENIIEERLHALLSEILGDNHLGINDNFLEKGSNSLHLNTFCAQIEASNIGKISAIDLFSYPSIKKLAQFIQSDHRENPKQISCLQLKFPEEYFMVSEDLPKNENVSVYIYEMPKDTYFKLSKIATRERVRIQDILLALYIYQLYIVSNQNEIPVQIMINHEDQVSLLIVNFDNIKDITELFKHIYLNCESNNLYTYSLRDFGNMAVRRDNTSIVPFFYTESKFKININLASIYDIIFGINESCLTLSLIFDYNPENLNHQKYEEFIHTYLQLIDTIIKTSD